MYDAPKKMSKGKKIELVVLICAIAWGVIFIVNYFRYSNSEPLIFAVKSVLKNYEDGTVTQYISFGYVYRIYERDSLQGEEFVPFWSPIKKSEATSSLPQTYKDYDVPKNSAKEDKYRGLLYYYKSSKLIGTYKCLNTATGCEKAISGYDEYDILNTEPLTALETQPTMYFYADRFAFVDDSLEQEVSYGSKQYIRIIYLLDIVKNEIIAKYEDVKHLTLDNWGKGLDVDGNFIVRDADNRKWGIINLSEEGVITEVLPFEYDSVNYDADTGFYILKKDGVWYGYDLEKKEKVTPDEKNVIYDIWENNNMTYYYKTGVSRTVGTETFMNYKIYKSDGNAFLAKDNIINVYERENFVMYLSKDDQCLHFIDYSGEEKHEPIKLYFTELEHDKLHHPAFEFEMKSSGSMNFKIYQGSELTYGYDVVYIATKKW